MFGYRTDSDYQTKQHLTEDQQKWLDEHPDFDYDADIAGAKQIAEALKEEGWILPAIRGTFERHRKDRRSAAY